MKFEQYVASRYRNNKINDEPRQNSENDCEQTSVYLIFFFCFLLIYFWCWKNVNDNTI